MSNCMNCDQVNDLWDENNKLKKAYDEVCAERDELKDKIIAIKKLTNIQYGLPKMSGISNEEYNKVCVERDKLKEENRNWKIICNALVDNNDIWNENNKLKKAYDEVCDKCAEQRGDYNDGLPKVEGKLLTENDIF